MSTAHRRDALPRSALAPRLERELEELGVELGPGLVLGSMSDLGKTPVDDARVARLREAVARRAERRGRRPGARGT